MKSWVHLWFPLLGCLMLAGCEADRKSAESSEPKSQPKQDLFVVDAATAGTIEGTVRYTGKAPTRKAVDLDGDPDCAKLYREGRRPDDAVIVNANGTLSNVLVYLKSGLEGKRFATPAQPVAIEQKGCWFTPRVLGLQAGQTLAISNLDPVTHNIHTMAVHNRDWNHSQSPGDPVMRRRLTREEVMIPVKCNIHGWMRASIGVVDHPYFAVTGENGSFRLSNVPPGTYVLAALHEILGSQQEQIVLENSGKVALKLQIGRTGK